MKYIKEHLMFIFPMLAILLGVESFMVFSRISHHYEQRLKSEYSILVLTSDKMSLAAFRKLSGEIGTVEKIEKRGIIQEMAKGLAGISEKEIMSALPYFYALHLGHYSDSQSIEKIKKRLLASPKVKKVENFSESHQSSYSLFLFIKLSLWTFLGFMTFSSLLLVIKQMEIWQYAHRERMQVMEIFGASIMLRSGILFKRALIDSLIATIATSGLFAFLRLVWAPKNSVSILIGKEDLLFMYRDIAILGGIAVLIVIIAVSMVVIGSREERL